ncbi:MAG: 4-(cytidine 5'-diphospho)-2-C-methyl-D-erythritol kinase, partial [Chitinophagaceae bacterium]
MIDFPNCKINLGLRILSKRDDGFHDLETIFYPLPFYDILELISPGESLIAKKTKEHQESFIEFTSSGLPVQGDMNDNLCIKALNLIRKDFPNLPAVKMHLHKVIPTGAGLGGGSADAAFTLALLNKVFDLNLSTVQLINYSLKLGSDCPFFILNYPALATGRGEILEPITLDLSNYKFVIVNPGIHINTREAFNEISPNLPAIPVKEIIAQPINNWKNELINDFEKIVFRNYEEIEIIKNKLYENGALYASMSG